MRRFSIFSGAGARCSTPIASSRGPSTPRFCSSSSQGTGKKLTDSPGKGKRPTSSNNTSLNSQNKIDGGEVAGTLRPSGRRSHLSIRCTSRSSAGGQVKEELRSYFSDDYMDLYHEASAQLQQQSPHPVDGDQLIPQDHSPASCGAVSSDTVPASSQRVLDEPQVSSSKPETQRSLDAAPERICSEENLMECLFRPSLGCPTELALQLRSQQKNLVGAIGPYDDLSGLGGASPMLLSWQLFDRYDSYACAPRSIPIVGYTSPPPAAAASSSLRNTGLQNERKDVAERDIIWV